MIATPKDVPHILEMGKSFCRALAEDYDEDTIVSTIMRMISSPTEVILVEDGGMVGAICYPHFFNVRHGIAQELFWWVNPDTRGNGIGVKLLAELEAWARDMGVSRLMVSSMASMPDIGVLYERKGFRRFEQNWIKELGCPSESAQRSSAAL